MDIQTTQSSNIAPKNGKSTLQGNPIDTPILVYYFDFECLPATHENSQLFDAEQFARLDPLHVFESFKHIKENKQLVKSIPMRRTKRAFNVYKCVIDSSCQSFSIKSNQRGHSTQNNKVDSNIDSANQNLNVKENGDNNIQQQDEKVNPQMMKVKNENQEQSLSKNSEENDDSKKQECKNNDKECAQENKNNRETQGKELVFDNPFYHYCEEVGNEMEQKNRQDSNQQNKTRDIQKKRRLVIYNEELIEIEERKEKDISIIVVTDLGGTLCGIPAATKQFMSNWIKYFWFDTSSKLIYNSGRGIHPFQLMMKEQQLVLPDYYIGRCGSSIYLKDLQSGFLYQDKEWLSELSQSWNPNLISEKFDELSNWLTFKKRNESEVWSLRYFSETRIFYEHEQEFKQVEKLLNDRGIQFNVISREKQNKMHIEIVPFITDKGFALEYLLHKAYYPNYSNYKTHKYNNTKKENKYCLNMKPILDIIYQKVKKIKNDSSDFHKFRINQDKKDLIIASFGDTMNDEGMLRLSNYSVCVKNSEQQLIDWVKLQNQSNLIISEHKNGYALVDFILQHI